MKLIVSELGALRGYVSREFYYVMRELIDVYGWRQIETAELLDARRPLRALLAERLGALPGTILFWEGYDLVNARGAELMELDCRKFIFADDLHSWDGGAKRRKRAAFLVCDAVLAAYAYTFGAFFPEVSAARPVVWVPHAASPDFLLPFDEGATNAVLLSGAINHHYPLRQSMKALADAGPYRVTQLEHPGYHCSFDHEGDPRVGPGYARAINRHRAAFAGSPRYGYLVAKHFEIPAAGSLLLADDAMREPLARLGFVAGVHYVVLSADDMERQLAHVTDARNGARLDEVRRAGQELVRARHLTRDRARLIDEVCAPREATTE
jgi:hypothetical protein